MMKNNNQILVEIRYIWNQNFSSALFLFALVPVLLLGLVSSTAQDASFQYHQWLVYGLLFNLMPHLVLSNHYILYERTHHLTEMIFSAITPRCHFRGRMLGLATLLSLQLILSDGLMLVFAKAFRWRLEFSFLDSLLIFPSLLVGYTFLLLQFLATSLAKSKQSSSWNEYLVVLPILVLAIATYTFGGKPIPELTKHLYWLPIVQLATFGDWFNQLGWLLVGCSVALLTTVVCFKSAEIIYSRTAFNQYEQID